MCYNIIEINESLLGTRIMMLLADPGFFITSVIHELLIAVGLLKSDLFQNVPTSLVLMNGFCEYSLHFQYAKRIFRRQDFFPGSEPSILDRIILHVYA